MEKFNVCVCDMGPIVLSCHQARAAVLGYFSASAWLRAAENGELKQSTRLMNINYGINEPRTTKPSGRWTLDVNRFKTWWVLSFRRKNLPVARKEPFVVSGSDLSGAGRPLLTLLRKYALPSKLWRVFKRKKHKILHNASEKKKEKSSNKPQEKSTSPFASLLHLNLGHYHIPSQACQLNY